MKHPGLFPIQVMFVAFTITLASDSKGTEAESLTSTIQLAGSTPGDNPVKSILAISPDTKVDFIRWQLVLAAAISGKKTFRLNIAFGESAPNTLGFVAGGEKKSITGEYDISPLHKNLSGTIYHLKSSLLAGEILLLQLSDNLFHLLTPQKKLMVGNGGWSYTLNRKEPVNHTTTALPVLTTAADFPPDTARQIIFEGRTPCADFAKENNLVVPSGCFKLKWKLTLHKDPQNLTPTFYTLRRTNTRQNDLTGKWTIVQQQSPDVQPVIYQLDPDKPDQSISLLLGDENVAFFLHKNQQLFSGNEDFSYTLNRRPKQ